MFVTKRRHDEELNHVINNCAQELQRVEETVSKLVDLLLAVSTRVARLEGKEHENSESDCKKQPSKGCQRAARGEKCTARKVKK